MEKLLKRALTHSTVGCNTENSVYSCRALVFPKALSFLLSVLSYIWTFQLYPSICKQIIQRRRVRHCPHIFSYCYKPQSEPKRKTEGT